MTRPEVTGRMPMETTQLQPFTCTMAEGTQLTGLSRSSLLRRADEGKLKTVFVSGRRLIVVESLKQMVLGPDVAKVA
jgi:hypothetical protein